MSDSFNCFNYCAVPENIHTHPVEGHWKFRGGGGSRKPKFLKESMELNWNFQRGGGIQTKKPFVGGVWIFSGTIQSPPCLFVYLVFSVSGIH